MVMIFILVSDQTFKETKPCEDHVAASGQSGG